VDVSPIAVPEVVFVDAAPNDNTSLRARAARQRFS
jgi:hypothetical protein